MRAARLYHRRALEAHRMSTYLLKADHQKKPEEVTREEWIKAERRAGFRPKMASTDPDYMDVCATAGFSGNGISGFLKF